MIYLLFIQLLSDRVYLFFYKYVILCGQESTFATDNNVMIQPTTFTVIYSIVHYFGSVYVLGFVLESQIYHKYCITDVTQDVEQI